MECTADPLLPPPAPAAAAAAPAPPPAWPAGPTLNIDPGRGAPLWQIGIIQDDHEIGGLTLICLEDMWRLRFPTRKERFRASMAAVLDSAAATLGVDRGLLVHDRPRARPPGGIAFKRARHGSKVHVTLGTMARCWWSCGGAGRAYVGEAICHCCCVQRIAQLQLLGEQRRAEHAAPQLQELLDAAAGGHRLPELRALSCPNLGAAVGSG